MKSNTDRLLLTVIIALAGILAWVVYPTLEQRIVQAGDSAPDFKVVTESGKTITRSDFGGKLLVLNFWASWCGPCVDEAPGLNAFSQLLQKDGVVVLGVSIDRNEQLYKQFLRNFNIGFEVARDPEWNINTSYGTFQFPETYIINAQGKVIEKIISADQNFMDEKFIQHVKSLL